MASLKLALPPGVLFEARNDDPKDVPILDDPIIGSSLPMRAIGIGAGIVMATDFAGDDSRCELAMRKCAPVRCWQQGIWLSVLWALLRDGQPRLLLEVYI